MLGRVSIGKNGTDFFVRDIEISRVDCMHPVGFFPTDVRSKDIVPISTRLRCNNYRRIRRRRRKRMDLEMYIKPIKQNKIKQFDNRPTSQDKKMLELI